MAWLKSGACVVALLGAAFLGGPVDAAVQSKACTEDCLLALNLARTARLNTRVGLLSKDAATEDAVVKTITDNTLAGADESNCSVAANLLPVAADVSGFMHTYPHSLPISCVTFVQAALDTGLNTLANYNNENWDNGTAAPYNSAAAQNLAYIMFAGATGAGCGVTSNCTGGNNILICRFTPSLDAQFTQPPFTKEFFAALKAREAKNIELSTLNQSDLNTNLDGSKPGGGGASSGRIGLPPGALPAAVLIITSLLGFVSFR